MGSTGMEKNPLTYALPVPDLKGSRPFEEVLSKRRSRRSFSDNAVSIEEISQILWAANGISGASDHTQNDKKSRTAPSAGATYPLELYLLAGNITGIDPGVYRHNPSGHSLIRLIDRDIKTEMASAALNQDMIETAPACLFFTAVFNRSTMVYGRRGSERYVCMDLGHAAQNVYLQAEALYLGTCAIGAFNDLAVTRLMRLPHNETPLYIMPVGRYYKQL
jgi:SagB-type dehydrogenase family enzyme